MQQFDNSKISDCGFDLNIEFIESGVFKKWSLFPVLAAFIFLSLDIKNPIAHIKILDQYNYCNMHKDYNKEIIF